VLLADCTTTFGADADVKRGQKFLTPSVMHLVFWLTPRYTAPFFRTCAHVRAVRCKHCISATDIVRVADTLVLDAAHGVLHALLPIKVLDRLHLRTLCGRLVGVDGDVDVDDVRQPRNGVQARAAGKAVWHRAGDIPLSTHILYWGLLSFFPCWLYLYHQVSSIFVCVVGDQM